MHYLKRDDENNDGAVVDGYGVVSVVMMNA